MAPIVGTTDGLNGSGSLLGSQYTYIVGFDFPTLGGSNLEAHKHLCYHQITFHSLLMILDPPLAHFSQKFNNLFLSLALSIYSASLVENHDYC